MPTVKEEIIVSPTAEEVFAYLADFRNELAWRHELVESRKVTSGPIGLGTVFEEVVKPPPPAPRAVMSREVSAYEPNRLIAWRQRSGSWDADGHYEVFDSAEGSRVVFENVIRAKGRMRFLAPIMIPLIRRTFIKPQFRALKKQLDQLAPVLAATG